MANATLKVTIYSCFLQPMTINPKKINMSFLDLNNLSNKTFKSTLASGELEKKIIHIKNLQGSISISIGKTDPANNRVCAIY